MIGVFIADAHQVVRAGVSLLINAEPDMTVIGEAKTDQEVWLGMRVRMPDVMVIEIDLPAEDGIALAKRLQDAYPHVAVLGLSPYDEEASMRRMLQAGAVGYVLKQSGASELVHAIRVLAAGGRHIDQAMRHNVLENGGMDE